MQLLRTGFQAACLLALSATVSQAEVNSVIIGETYGLTHLASHVLVDNQFIQKEAAARGLPAVDVAFKQVGNGNVVADLLLSGGVNVAISGVVPFLSLRSKVRRSSRSRESSRCRKAICF